MLRCTAFEEKVLDVSPEGAVVAVVVSPPKYSGRLYRYEINQSKLELSEVNSGRKEMMKPCQ